MKFIRLMACMVLAACLFLFTGCGSGSKDLNGSLTVDAEETEESSYVKIDYTVEYSNPYTDNVLGTEVKVTTKAFYLDGAGELIPELSDTFEYSTNNSGITYFGYAIPKINRPYAFQFSARTGDLTAYDTTTVAAIVIPVTAFTATPSTVEFGGTTTGGDSIQVLLAGGTPPYKIQNINPSSSVTGNKYITASIDENILTITRKDIVVTADVTASILLLDSATVPASLQVPVTVKAFGTISTAKAGFK